MKKTSARFDPESSWAPIDARIATEQDSRCRQLLEQVRDHMRHEIRGELPELMCTLVDEPRYHIWGAPTEAGPKGRAAVEQFYTQMIEGGGNWFHFAIERIVVDHGGVITEGQMRQRVPGDAVAASGVLEVDGEPVDPLATYLSMGQILTVWPAAEDGRLIGEDIYLGSPLLARLVKLEE
ncbi:MAG: nuclear transport factor 2 family protein [Deltaproteobacteria bacterium]|nr:nuclear transport factor 2 family protein [Deltaproteobacteria bacterium]